MLFLAQAAIMSQTNKSRKKPTKVTKPKRVLKTERQNIYKYLVPALAITFLVFLPSLQNGFTNWDDTVYVTNKPLLHNMDGDGLKAIFSTPVVSNYHPLTILSLALNYQFAELNPWSYHFTSILLH